jgi:hypothetical protein
MLLRGMPVMPPFERDYPAGGTENGSVPSTIYLVSVHKVGYVADRHYLTAVSDGDEKRPFHNQRRLSKLQFFDLQQINFYRCIPAKDSNHHF